jgi:hypothetical protein
MPVHIGHTRGKILCHRSQCQRQIVAIDERVPATKPVVTSNCRSLPSKSVATATANHRIRSIDAGVVGESRWRRQAA